MDRKQSTDDFAINAITDVLRVHDWEHAAVIPKKQQNNIGHFQSWFDINSHGPSMHLRAICI